MKYACGLIRFLAVVCLGFVVNAYATESSVKVTFDTKNPGAAIPEDFSGLSFEVALVLPGPDGVHYFRPDNVPLIQLFHTLGIRNLRIGGNTSDRDAKQLPSKADLDSLFAFAKAANVKVIYCLRLHNGDSQEAARTVKYVMDRYAPQVDCFSIGQEPSAYPTEKRDTRASTERMGATNEKYRYESFREEWKRFADAIIAEVPNVKLCGPSVHNNADWARRFMTDFAQSNHVSLITEHLYPGGAGGRVPSPEFGRERMLSNDFVRVYQRLHDGFVPMAISNSLPFRLEEVNNYFNGGATNVSNTFASALWGLDFMFWWASHSAAGVNFHTGDRVAAGNSLQPSKYTAFFSTTNGYLIRPLGYGIKAFALAGSGRLIPVSVSAQAELNLSTYAVLGADGTLSATFINKEHGVEAHDADVKIGAGDFSRAEILFLTAPNSDIAATSGVKLGDAEIKNDGTWRGEWKALSPAVDGEFRFKLQAATAAIVKLSRVKHASSFPGTKSSWEGFDRYDFEFNGKPAIVITPKQTLSGKPWAWRGEFFGAYANVDVALLSNGFHVAYLRVPDQFGSPEAVNRWNEFYQELTTKYGFAKRPALIGLSRGGLYCYNWAIANPDKVACIYADAPVCDFKSWPGRKLAAAHEGDSTFKEWQKLLRAYDFRSDAEALAYRGNPVDNLKPLADAKVSLLHVYGEADTVVPWQENTGAVAERYRALGGDMTLIPKPGVDHHPHGLTDPMPIVNFILKHAAVL